MSEPGYVDGTLQIIETASRALIAAVEDRAIDVCSAVQDQYTLRDPREIDDVAVELFGPLISIGDNDALATVIRHILGAVYVTGLRDGAKKAGAS